MSNNDGADFARSISVGEELSRLMVEAEYLREENKRLREALQKCVLVIQMEIDSDAHTTAWTDLCCATVSEARAALGEGKE